MEHLKLCVRVASGPAAALGADGQAAGPLSGVTGPGAGRAPPSHAALALAVILSHPASGASVDARGR